MTGATAQATTEFSSQGDAQIAAAALADGDLTVVDKKTEIIEEPPLPPYDTAALLEDATMILQWNAERVMQVAQALFEGIELYGAHVGLITYHRTDSQLIAPEAQAAARAIIARLYGKDTLPPAPILALGGGSSRINAIPQNLL